MSSPFPLLRLPRLVLCEVFKSLSIGEKMKLSFCSKKISIQIYNARLYSQKVIVDLDWPGHKIEVYSENYRDLFEISIYHDFWKRHNLNTQQYSIVGCAFLSAIEHLLKMFQCKFSTHIRLNNSDLYRPAISMLFDRQVEFKRISIRHNGSENENLLFNQMSSNFRLVEYVSIYSVYDHSFRLVFTSWPQNITIWSSDWFTLEYLLACTCSRITLWNSLLGNKDTDVILKNWKAGGFSNLEYLCIESQNITNNGELILGMNLRELDGKVIQTDDGLKKATIKTYADSIEMFVTPSE
ncbi:hypothetical protein GCK72_003173 [Caenorhabditis remanei]|uniref:F-box domain-containing protein n=1 Tax=Caenorhabditis remanei TaxID=31234 RepID=A0A6A5HXR6_CAERE|nr:hypothetical protein GCK72_003173 [Caenorhabditis remanei]KAF1771347.1 hypothetical protein GCK72_003173 [Caenorhabditis remanei]